MKCRWALSLLASTATWSFATGSVSESVQEQHQCGAGESAEGKCGYDDGTGSYESSETGRGAGTDTVPKCGPWCADAPGEDHSAPCSIDTKIMPCRGEYWCTTTCALWKSSILDAKKPDATVLTCEQFIRTSAFPLGGTPCEDECLLDEIKPNRYPAPTGLGFLCAPGTCDPAVQSRYRATAKQTEVGLAVLECPCNWFGSDCDDDWVEISEVVRKERHGDFETTVLRVSDDGWRRDMADHRPGGVVRIQALSKNAWGARPLEQPYALATDIDSGVVGELEILTGPPEIEKYHSTVTEIARKIRSLPIGPIQSSKGEESAPLYINPSIAGFFNKQYMFLMDALAAESSTIKHIVMVATGAGLSGLRSAISKILSDDMNDRSIHLYYGLRDSRHLPYRDLVESWAMNDKVYATILVSSVDEEALVASEPGISRAIGRGLKLKEDFSSIDSSCQSIPERLEMLPASGKIYAQHALGVDFSTGSLRRDGSSLKNTAVVICGRNELLLETDNILQNICDSANHEEDGGSSGTSLSCDDLLKQRVFTNI